MVDNAREMKYRKFCLIFTIFCLYSAIIYHCILTIFMKYAIVLIRSVDLFNLLRGRNGVVPMSQEVITFVPEHSLRPRRMGKYLFIDVVSFIGLCWYVFATGQFPVFYDQGEPSEQEPAVSVPVQSEPEPTVPPMVTNNERQRQLRQAFRIGQAVARLEKSLEVKSSR